MGKRTLEEIMNYAKKDLTKTEFNAETNKIKNFVKDRNRESTKEENTKEETNNGMDR